MDDLNAKLNDFIFRIVTFTVIVSVIGVCNSGRKELWEYHVAAERLLISKFRLENVGTKYKWSRVSERVKQEKGSQVVEISSIYSRNHRIEWQARVYLDKKDRIERIVIHDYKVLCKASGRHKHSQLLERDDHGQIISEFKR